MPNPKTNPKRPARFAKSWTFDELDAYNIRITTVDTNTFFGISDLPAPVVSPVILQHVNAPSDLPLSNGDYCFFRSLRGTTLDTGAVHDFTRNLLGPVLEIEDFGRFIFQIPKLPFIMSGQRVYATPNLTMQDKDDYLILIVETEKTSGDREEPRLVASALATFTADNRKRANAGLPPLASKRYIGIGMIRSAPRLYKITITQALLDAVVTSQRPVEETIIERFVPPIPNMDSFFDEGMWPLENRYICFQCFEALRALL